MNICIDSYLRVYMIMHALIGSQKFCNSFWRAGSETAAIYVKTCIHIVKVLHIESADISCNWDELSYTITESKPAVLFYSPHMYIHLYGNINSKVNYLIIILTSHYI